MRAVGETAIIERGREYTVAEATFNAPLHHVFVHTGTSHGVLNYTDDMFEPVAVAPATATLTIEAGKFYKTRDGRKVGPMEEWREGAFREAEGDGRFWHKDGEGQVRANGEDIVSEWVDEPVVPATPIDTTLGIDLNPAPPPQVGDEVLIPGVISAINQSPRGTNYNIVFETQNRRMSLHFLDEDFILDECGDDEGDCQCANDNGPDPADTAKAFDALGDWLRSLAVERAA